MSNSSTVNIRTQSIGVSDFIKQALKTINDHTDPDTIAVRNFNTLFLNLDSSPKVKQSKGTSELKCTMDELDACVCVHRIFHPTEREHTFFSE